MRRDCGPLRVRRRQRRGKVREARRLVDGDRLALVELERVAHPARAVGHQREGRRAALARVRGARPHRAISAPCSAPPRDERTGRRVKGPRGAAVELGEGGGAADGPAHAVRDVGAAPVGVVITTQHAQRQLRLRVDLPAAELVGEVQLVGGELVLLLRAERGQQRAQQPRPPRRRAHGEPRVQEERRQAAAQLGGVGVVALVAAPKALGPRVALAAPEPVQLAGQHAPRRVAGKRGGGAVDDDGVEGVGVEDERGGGGAVTRHIEQLQHAPHRVEGRDLGPVVRGWALVAGDLWVQDVGLAVAQQDQRQPVQRCGLAELPARVHR